MARRAEEKNMRSTSLFLCLGVVLCSSAAAMAKPAYVLTTVNLRAAPGTSNEVVAKIPGGSLVDAADCTDGWCAVNWRDKSGFAIQSALDLSGRVPPRGAPGPRGGPPPGYVVEEDGPIYYEPGPPPPVYYGRPYYRPYWPRYRHYW
jgi:uncharacterized protein YraI